MTNFDYPVDCIQGGFKYSEWWGEHNELKPGSLVKAVIPYFESDLYRMVPIGRENPTDHSGARARLSRFTLGTPGIENDLPVAASEFVKESRTNSKRK